MSARALYFTAPYELEIREVEVPDPDPNEVKIDAELSAISSGTELLVYRGDIPRTVPTDRTIQSLQGTFEFPLQYGYAVVGRVTEAGAGLTDDWLGARVFAFHPHASEFVAPVDDVVRLPEDCPAGTAAVLANLEAATNFLLDGHPLVGERVLVFGQGVVGLLTTALLGRFPLASLVAVEPHERRRELSRAFGADRCLDPAGDEVAELGALAGNDGAPTGADLTYELSGDPAALSTAIDATGFGGRVVVGSWYGSRPVELDLGGHFHRSRIRLVSSQVSSIDPSLRGRWSRERRLRTAQSWLDAIDVDALVTHRLPIEDAAEAYALLDERPADAVQVLLTY